MYDQARNKLYYETDNNQSPATIKKMQGVLRKIGKGIFSQDAGVQMITENLQAALSNCVSVSKHTDITLMNNAINGINSILSELEMACEIVAGGISLIHGTDLNGESPGRTFNEEEYEEEIYNLIDSARDNLFGVRQTIVEMCSE